MSIERRLNLRFAPERFDKLDEKRSQERLTFQEIGVRLFEYWLSGTADPAVRGGLRRPADPYMERFAILLAHNDEALVSMTKKSIDVAWGVLQHSVPPEEIQHLRAVAYGEAPRPPKEVVPLGEPRKRGRPRKTA